MTKFIVDFYPVIPNEWIRVEPIIFDDGRNSSAAESLLAQYEMGIEKGRMTKFGIVPYNNSWFGIIEADTARVSLKTDEAYQLMYEGVEVYDKDTVAWMFRELQLEIEKTVKEEELIDKKWANGLHYSEKIIQQKINALKGDTNER